MPIPREGSFRNLSSLPGHAFRVTECPGGVQEGLLEDILPFQPSSQSLSTTSPLTTTLFPCQSGDTSGYACYAHKPQSFRPGCQEREERGYRKREQDEALSLWLHDARHVPPLGFSQDRFPSDLGLTECPQDIILPSTASRNTTLLEQLGNDRPWLRGGHRPTDRRSDLQPGLVPSIRRQLLSHNNFLCGRRERMG